MKISNLQFEAALALAGLTQKTLSELSGISMDAIQKFIGGRVSPREQTLSALLKVIASRGIEFTENEGVRKRPEGLEILNGIDGMAKFWATVFTSAEITGGVIRQNGIAEKPLDQCAPEAAAAHRERMLPLVKSRKDIFIRAILEEGDTNFLCTKYADYKWHPKEAPPPVPYYIFGDSVAIFAFESDPSPKIILITSPIIASAYIKQFDRAWELAKTPIIK